MGAISKEKGCYQQRKRTTGEERQEKAYASVEYLSDFKKTDSLTVAFKFIVTHVAFLLIVPFEMFQGSPAQKFGELQKLL